MVCVACWWAVSASVKHGSSRTADRKYKPPCSEIRRIPGSPSSRPCRPQSSPNQSQYRSQTPEPHPTHSTLAVPGHQPNNAPGSACPSEEFAFLKSHRRRRPGCHAVQLVPSPNMRQNFPDQGRLLTAGDDPQRAPARAGRHTGKASCEQARKPPCQLSRRSGHVSMSMANTRFRRWAQDIGASGLSLSTRPLGRWGTIR